MMSEKTCILAIDDVNVSWKTPHYESLVKAALDDDKSIEQAYIDLYVGPAIREIIKVIEANQ